MIRFFRRLSRPVYEVVKAIWTKRLASWIFDRLYGKYNGKWHSENIKDLYNDFFHVIAAFRNFKDTEGVPFWDGPVEDTWTVKPYRFGSTMGNKLC